MKTPTYTGLQVQTSSQALPIPIVWGANRISGNVIDYFNFYSQPASKGKGGLGKGNDNDYFADVMIALCEGAGEGYLLNIGFFWANQGVYWFPDPNSDTGFGLYHGTPDQSVWSNAAAVGHDLGYSNTALIVQGNLPLGESAEVPQYNAEVYSRFTGHNVNTEVTNFPDANMGDIIPDLLTNTQYTLAMDPELLDTPAFEFLTTYHLYANLFFSPTLKDQEQVTSILSRWATLGNYWIFWTGTLLTVVPLGDTGGTNNGVTYTPNVTPIYDLGPDDFQVDSTDAGAAPPITVKRKAPEDCYNMVQLDCTIRGSYTSGQTGGTMGGSSYNSTPFRWFDQSEIDAAKVQASNVISAPEICNQVTAGNAVSLIGQRQLYIRNTYEFKLLSNFCLLLPGDIVTLTDPNIGLDLFPVRITSVTEDDKDTLTLEAEEFPQGVGTATQIDFQTWDGQAPYNPGDNPSSVNTPVFYQPPPSETQGVSQVWVGASGATSWGGCGVFLSFDGVNYSQIGEIDQATCQGTLTYGLPLATGVDTTNPLEVVTTESQLAPPTAMTEADAQAFRSICMVDDEIIAFAGPTPTGDFSATYDYLIRGVFGTTPAAHAAGAPFAVLSSAAMFAYNLPQQYVGTPLYFFFPSVNEFGAQPQSLADCTEYVFAPAGPPNGVITGAVYQYSGATFVGVQVNWTPPAGQNPTGYVLQFGTETAPFGYLNAPGGSASAVITAAEITAAGVTITDVSLQATYGQLSSGYTAFFAVTGTPP
jgi:hypothetical protein